MTGREFKSKDEFEKHYKNLSSFVGKKTEDKPKPAKEELTDLMAKVSGLEQTVKERDFIYEKPESKEHLDLVPLRRMGEFPERIKFMKIGRTKLKMSSGEVRTFKTGKARNAFERVAQAVKTFKWKPSKELRT